MTWQLSRVDVIWSIFRQRLQVQKLSTTPKKGSMRAYFHFSKRRYVSKTKIIGLVGAADFDLIQCYFTASDNSKDNKNNCKSTTNQMVRNKRTNKIMMCFYLFEIFNLNLLNIGNKDWYQTAMRQFKWQAICIDEWVFQSSIVTKKKSGKLRNTENHNEFCATLNLTLTRIEAL